MTFLRWNFVTVGAAFLTLGNAFVTLGNAFFPLGNASVTLGAATYFGPFQPVPNTESRILAARIITATKPHLANNVTPAESAA